MDAAEISELLQAINTNDLGRVKALMTQNRALHHAPLGYGEDGPLTWVAECRVPWEDPSPERLAMAEWMIANGSDVHQGGDGPLMRAALNGYRIPMMEVLVRHGADVNALWHGHFPILFASCESMDAECLRWLLHHGADPNIRDPRQNDTPLDYLIAGYARSLDRLSACIEALLAAGAETRFNHPAFLAILRGRDQELAEHLDKTPGLVTQRFPELDCGQSGGRFLLLTGATLLHVAAEYGNLEAARLLLARGADVNAPALINPEGIGGQTPIFHAVTQYDDYGLPVARLLLEHGADRNIRVKLPGDYERPGEIVECTPLEYALRFGGEPDRTTVALLRQWQTQE